LSKGYLAYQVLVSTGLTLLCELLVHGHSKLQGTNMSLEDAVELARAIGKWVCRDLPAWIAPSLQACCHLLTCVKQLTYGMQLQPCSLT
jgi:hypothetical protein